MLLPYIFIFEFFILFLLSRKTINILFRFLKVIFNGNKKAIYSSLSLIFFPGTVIHELSHFLVAILLFLKVRSIRIFPSWSENKIKLGSVLYEKRDPVSGVLVGIAPIFAGFLFFFFMSQVGILTAENIYIKLVGVLLIFIISTTMFSSKEDLKDVLYAMPFFITLSVFIYIFREDFAQIINFKTQILAVSSSFLYSLSIYLGSSILIHFVIILFMSLFIKKYNG